MLQERKIAKEQVTTFTETIAISQPDIGNSRFGIAVIMTMAGFVGVWGGICLINGIVQSQSIQELAHGVFTAFTGI